jgi:hypothetical protein
LSQFRKREQSQIWITQKKIKKKKTFMTMSTNPFKGLLKRAKRSNQRGSHEQEPDLPHEVSQRNGQNRQQMSAMDKVIEFLTNDGNWRFQVDRERSLVHTTGDSSEGSFRIAIDVKEDLCTLIVYVLSPVRVPEGNKRLQVAEFITRANYGIMIGNFEMDFRDGEVRYKGALEYADGDLTIMMIEKLIEKCAYTMARYFKGLMKIIYADMDPATAICEIEPGQGTGNAILDMIASLLAVQLESSDDEVPESPVIEILDEDGATLVTPILHAPEVGPLTPASSTDDEANEEM